MDIGRILVFIPIAIYCLYSFSKSKLNIYIILAVLAWYVAIYSGKTNIYQTLGESLKSALNMITLLLLVVMFMPYLKKSIVEYKNHK